MWKFDVQTVDLIWSGITDSILSEDGVLIDFANNGDLEIDLGFRMNTQAVIDQGQRILNGSA